MEIQESGFGSGKGKEGADESHGGPVGHVQQEQTKAGNLKCRKTPEGPSLTTSKKGEKKKEEFFQLQRTLTQRIHHARKKVPMSLWGVFHFESRECFEELGRGDRRREGDLEELGHDRQEIGIHLDHLG